MTYDLDPRVVDQVARALKQGHRITPCPSCFGPRVWSLTLPRSRCLRCLRYAEGVQVKQLHRLRCEDCHRKFECIGLKKPYCGKCSEKREVARKTKADIDAGVFAANGGRILRPDLDAI